MTVAGNSAVTGDLTVEGKTTLADTDVNGNMKVAGDTVLEKDLTVKGDSKFEASSVWNEGQDNQVKVTTGMKQKLLWMKTVALKARLLILIRT